MKLLNHEKLEALRELLSAGDLNRLLKRVASDLGPQVRQLCASVLEGDKSAVRALVHRLKGTLSNFGCDALVETLIRIEAGFSSEPMYRPSSEALKQVEVLALDTVRALEHYINGSGGNNQPPAC
jgi:HPt (histidine-containing phosphotransfer) domain-containing protein